MPNPTKTIAIVNGTGRQAASVIRAVTAVGYAVRAQVYSIEGLVAEELAELPNVELFEGELLDNPELIETIFDGANIAFINTIHLAGDEIKIGKALANAAKKRNIQHFVYSSMPDHSIHYPKWPALPLWACKFTVENYIRQLGLPATFVYAGIYNNNFTSLPYPLFCMDFKDDGTLEWRAPFHPDTKLPWLDAEHDVGPAVLQIFKDGPNKWNGSRIALAFEMLTPNQVCDIFGRALDRPCNYVFDNHIEIKVPVPNVYRQQLAGIELLFGIYNAPYFPGPEFEYASRRKCSNDTITGRSSTNYESSLRKGKPGKLTDDARKLWPGWRSMSEYVSTAFIVEEEANGKTWMIDKTVSS
ncbi:nitrogen metabolite repression protein nmrA [Capronia coronata CBS 617.96]|uniref:Nitrogen metabolite repression protein nmrA n=1 Tax=Capronia coronata CBS 617.96 TaxID=1182541 RepID=W9YW75_9EURO|nr:nitrogen metabolite repression protein nmrA [Capronia coronata CBS 617.96]EXJ93521.1 nitrogen metabolite repression protein nmrA [Capronia coronata CBS 617.96]